MMRDPFLPGVLFQAIAWNSVPPVAHPGASGTATMRTVDLGSLRLRQIEYSPGYRSDHWCRLGHVALILEGEIELQIRNGITSRLSAGASFVMGTETNEHFVTSKNGSMLFVVD